MKVWQWQQEKAANTYISEGLMQMGKGKNVVREKVVLFKI
jgi:hypothetical protein